MTFAEMARAECAAAQKLWAIGGENEWKHPPGPIPVMSARTQRSLHKGEACAHVARSSLSHLADHTFDY